ncbi:PEP-CTERM sorting domain-containing protein [Massilia sp. TW-1]|uniref:PEP-CTERM sorting domain-containing protein n=1 Tax=Telluria antibiotica TaxID=2717319 RepID=A0ABX0PCJ5_9BURK|nr:CCXG family PEP-CTERM protein [Telluria antibiotica]NIA53830.1 PEP-CTERM sorting domain-containing protein [Telluria antibiotica]
MKVRTACCAALLAGLALDANASVITLQVATGPVGTHTSAAAYKAAVDADIANPAGYKGSKTVATYDNVTVKNYFGALSNYAFEATIDFGVTSAQAGTWNFRTGVDFGYGGALFVDGVALGYNAHDMWWANNYATANGSLTGSAVLAAGNHELKIYGMEACCDGSQQAQFKAANTAAFKTFAGSDTLNAVPEPMSIATFGLGAGVMALIRRRRRKSA